MSNPEQEVVETAYIPSVRAASMLYGAEEAPVDDLAELFHEASKLYPSFAARQTRGQVLEGHLALRVSTLRAVKRSTHLTAISLPDPELPSTPFGEVIEARRSEREFEDRALTLAELTAVLHAAYGTTHSLDPDAPGFGPALRTVPSGGGLFPLEIYAVAWRVDGLEPTLYHFDPLRRVLERVGADELESQVRDASVYPEAALGCGALIVVTAMFWRTRFKYALRGYRFALLEAGHLMQNALLTSTALGLGSVALGGFFDRRLDRIIGLDGVNESTLYAAAIGVRKGEA